MAIMCLGLLGLLILSGGLHRVLGWLSTWRRHKRHTGNGGGGGGSGSLSLRTFLLVGLAASSFLWGLIDMVGLLQA